MIISASKIESGDLVNSIVHLMYFLLTLRSWMSSRLIFLGIVLSTLPILHACQKKGCTDSEALNYNEDAKEDDGSCTYAQPAFIIEVEHLVNGSPLTLMTEEYENGFKTKYTIHRLQYYLSQIELKGIDKTEMVTDFWYSDFGENGNYTLTLENAAVGGYDSLVFFLGLTTELNISYHLPNDIENINMQWPDPIGGGYHYMKFEGRFEDVEDVEKNFNVHLGKLVTDTLTTNPIVRFSFPLDGVGYSDKTWHLHMVMDLNQWFEGGTRYDFNEFDAGIMMNHNAQSILKDNGSDVFNLTEAWEQ